MDNLRYWFYDSELDDFKKRMKKSKITTCYCNLCFKNFTYFCKLQKI